MVVPFVGFARIVPDRASAALPYHSALTAGDRWPAVPGTPHPFSRMLLLKLALVPAAILLATLAARRFGHAVSGVLAGFPLIAGPIIAALMIDLPPSQISGIGAATLAASPAAIAHIVAFAWLSRWLSWWACLFGAALAFFAVGGMTTSAWIPASVGIVLAIAAPFLALLLMPRTSRIAGAVHVPRSEIAVRVGAAFVLAAAILASADHVPAAISGLLLAWPISGSILPSFTLPVHGHAATVTLLRGFATGLIGFVMFFVSLVVLLRAWDANWPSFAVAACVSCAAGGTVHWLRQRSARTAPVR